MYINYIRKYYIVLHAVFKNSIQKRLWRKKCRNSIHYYHFFNICRSLIFTVWNFYSVELNTIYKPRGCLFENSWFIYVFPMVLQPVYKLAVTLRSFVSSGVKYPSIFCISLKIITFSKFMWTRHFNFLWPLKMHREVTQHVKS